LWVGKSFKSTKKKKWVWGGKKIKVPNKKIDAGEKKTWERGGEKIKLQKKNGD
jgi:hypothetical protein